jgi:hypothetical protein
MDDIVNGRPTAAWGDNKRRALVLKAKYAVINTVLAKANEVTSEDEGDEAAARAIAYVSSKVGF